MPAGSARQRLLRVAIGLLACACGDDDNAQTGAQSSGNPTSAQAGSSGRASRAGSAANDSASGAGQSGAGQSSAGQSSAGQSGAGQSSAGQSGAGQSNAGQSSSAPAAAFGKTYEGGQFHLGPVDWEESQWHNACAPSTKYASQVRKAEGDLLAGLWVGIPNVAGYCDACIEVKTAMGKSATLRVVTYGDTTQNSIDVSPAAFEILDSGEYPRAMTWQFAACPNGGSIYYEFQTGSSEWWTSLWVRNARLPLAKVEVKSANHANFVELERGGDGTLTDGGGFGNGPFTIRLTAIDGSELSESFDWPSGGIAGKTLEGTHNL
jgi:expansin